jgi:GT2 family glycosyltransferase/predicted Zn-dependent protease
MHRYLLGPVSVQFTQEHLRAAREGWQCIAFDYTGNLDLDVQTADRWQEIVARLPQDWQPDFIVLYLPYATIPHCFWSVPVPLIGLAMDWSLQFHSYRGLAVRYCDLILTDALGVETFRREGITHVRQAVLFGCAPDYVNHPWPDVQRDIDILFVGNLHPAVQNERLPWVARLAGLADRYRVVIREGIFGDEYRNLLARSRIVFNRSIRGECNKRVFEAAAAGALLFQEADNREIGQFFSDGQDCVLYTDENLESLLEYYLEHEEERRQIAEAARAKVGNYSFESLWEEQLKLVDKEWPEIQERAKKRLKNHGTHRPHGKGKELQSGDLLGRTWQAVGSVLGNDPSLPGDLASAIISHPQDADLHNALGVAVALQQQAQGPTTGDVAQRVSQYFQRAVDADPAHAMARLNLIEALLGAGQTDAALEHARRVLELMDCQRGNHGTDGLHERKNTVDATGQIDSLPCVRCVPWFDAPRFPPVYDLFRVEWEKAAWSNAGQAKAEIEAKKNLNCWRLHGLLAELTGDLSHAYEAAIARPDLRPTREILGSLLLGARRPKDAIPHLKQAVALNPFDCDSARQLFRALGEAGDGMAQRELAGERRLLVQAASELVPAEPWIMNTPPAGKELASIIILCSNHLEFTRMCLDSVLKYTRGQYELIVVDNGSTDGTAEYLSELRRSGNHGTHGPHGSNAETASNSVPRVPRVPWFNGRVVVLRNETNLGFARGCNQALAHARGRYVVFLNNDTIVTRGWLDGLVGWAVHDWPNVGLVGPMTNYASPPQQIPVPYDGSVDGTLRVPDPAHGVCGLHNYLDVFAARRNADYTGQALEVQRLTGFCLLVRREVLEQIGGFDEQFGVGFFEDDDLCVRAREKGYKLLVALNVFIHHFGSRTFAGLGIDAQKQLKQNFEQFKAKWGEERAKGYRMPEREENRGQKTENGGQKTEVSRFTVDGDDPTLLVPRVSLTMIVKNEEANLFDCLDSVADLVGEIVIVDTGSTDNTKKIARKFGATIVDFPWVDDFAAARNEALKHATGKWIFWMDADDRLDRGNNRKLKQFFAHLPEENVAFSMKCLCVPETGGQSGTVVDHVRLFRNRPDLRWKYRVHEQILGAVREAGGDIRFADIVIQHVGYQDKALRGRKLERDLRLLEMENVEHPDDPFTLFNLASVHLELGRPEEALPFLRRSLELSDPGASIVRKLYAQLVQCYRKLGKCTEALDACRCGRAFYPDDTELLFHESQVRHQLQDRAGAVACLERILQSRDGAHFASVDSGLRGYKSRHNLAVLHRELGQLAEAEAQWRMVVAEQPAFAAGWVGLGELYLGQKRWTELAEVLDRMAEAAPEAQTERRVLQARMHLARQQFTSARVVLGEAIAAAPEAVWPREILTHVLLQEGNDLEKAERALRELLAIDPGNQEAKRNLEVLLRQKADNTSISHR